MAEKLNRRQFLQKATIATVAGTTGLLAGCSIGQPEVESAPAEEAVEESAPAEESAAAATEEAMESPNVNTNQTIRWQLVTTWPPTLPIFMDGVRMMAEQIAIMSEGRLEIEVFGGGELVGALESFDAVDAGTAQMGHGAAYYWGGKAPASQFFTSVPFGMNAQQMYGWLYAGGGLELWEETYADFNLVPIPCGNTGIQMGGWFNKEINSVDDLVNLKMRMPGLGGKTLVKVGASAELIPGGEIYTSLERGVIDATEWVGPYHDQVLGLHQVAQYYYYPGWHEPGSVLELLVNRQQWDELSPDLQNIVRRAGEAQNTWMLSQFEGNNNTALQQLINEEGVELRQFPEDVMNALRTAAEEVLTEVADSDPMSRQVYDSFRAFQEQAAQYGQVSEQAYYNQVQMPVS